MAERALPSGAVPRRVLFGLFDASGWALATVKAVFWFLVIWVAMGYLPDRAYYFTVFKTIDLNAIAGFERVLGLQEPPFFGIVNFCPPENAGLPCPAPTGSVIPWQTSPAQLALPAPRKDAVVLQAGVRIFLAGGRGADGVPVKTIVATTRVEAPPSTTGELQQTGNLEPWTEAPPLPEPRAEMAATSFSGLLYLVGGVDATGAPTSTVWVGKPDPKTGEVSEWTAPKEMQLPAPRTAAVALTIPTGMLVIGGSDGKARALDTVFFNPYDSASGKFKGWQEEPPGLNLPQPRRDATGHTVPGFAYVIGGRDADGRPTGSVFRLSLSKCPADPNANCTVKDLPGQWATAGGNNTLFRARASAAGFTANGTLYVIGGDAEQGPTGSLYWVVPDKDGNFSKGGWQQLDVTNLHAARSHASVAVIGSYVFLIGGVGDKPEVGTNMERANLAPALPFFRLGLFGVTIPALGIKGELGQQLGYLAAGVVDTTSFILLLILGWAFTHKEQSWRFLERVSRGRLHPPRRAP